ncbi:hypothetical protein KP509_33G020600 [Ceratopteris richardii]|uniref:Uncharacterized protein n=1 Tax=Ceratopteris richardii TaxID=49495 RepID=A0A8T2QP05_CERRI|nr:hypothetical protein KP509_33G020600 [Ceratopteris richardii]
MMKSIERSNAEEDRRHRLLRRFSATIEKANMLIQKNVSNPSSSSSSSNGNCEDDHGIQMFANLDNKTEDYWKKLAEFEKLKQRVQSDCKRDNHSHHIRCIEQRPQQNILSSFLQTWRQQERKAIESIQQTVFFDDAWDVEIIFSSEKRSNNPMSL